MHVMCIRSECITSDPALKLIAPPSSLPLIQEKIFYNLSEPFNFKALENVVWKPAVSSKEEATTSSSASLSSWTSSSESSSSFGALSSSTSCEFNTSNALDSMSYLSVLGVSSERQLKIFMAELPSKYTHDLYDQYWGFEYYRGMTWENPLGPPVMEDVWETNQFSAGLWFHKQIAASPLRVSNASEADVVFVPIFTSYLVNHWHR